MLSTEYWTGDDANPEFDPIELGFGDKGRLVGSVIVENPLRDSNPLIWANYKPLPGVKDIELLEAIESCELFTGSSGASSPYSLTAGFDMAGGVTIAGSAFH